MNDQQKKKWIKQRWNLSSGDKITEMLKRYWNLKKTDEKKEYDEYEQVKEVFKDLM